MNELIELQPTDLGLALGLMAMAIGLSFWQQLGLTRNLALATIRTLVQLMVMGYVLSFVFSWRHPGAVAAVIAVMVTVATLETRNRIGKPIPTLVPLLWGSIFISTALTLVYTTGLILQPETWFDPQYLIPLAGIVLGNAINGAAIAGERLVQLIYASRQEIETHLCLGAMPQQAIADYRKEAIKAGLIPTINAMMVVGLVKLPGIITGQLLSGVDPLNAASYQILIMFMLAFATLLATILVTQGMARQFFNPAAQLVLP